MDEGAYWSMHTPLEVIWYNCRFVILRWTAGTSGSLSRAERRTISVRNSLHELLNRSIHFTAQNIKLIHYVLIFNIAPIHGGNKLL